MSGDERWAALVSAALIGTDRREPAPPPPGPVADVVADTTATTSARRLLVEVAAIVTLRRAGFLAGPPVTSPDPGSPGEADRIVDDIADRPLVPVHAVTTWRRIVDEWPVLEDEWLLEVVRGRWQLPADVLVDLLERHRGDTERWERVARAGGEVVPWLAPRLPALRRRGADRAPLRSEADLLPALPMPPELAVLVDAGPEQVVDAVVDGCASKRFVPPDRRVFANLLARCRPAALSPAAAALRSIDGPAQGLARSLADLAELRARMLEELACPDEHPSGSLAR